MSQPQLGGACAWRSSELDRSMNPMAQRNTSGVPDDVLLLINGIVIGLIILCAALVGFVRSRDRASEKRSKK